MRVLVACECSGRVRDAFLDAGHDAISCDLQPSDSDRGTRRHVQGDVSELLGAGWDLVVAHPPCTYLCNSGVRWLHDGRWPWRMDAMRRAAWFFRACLNANAHAVAVENPIPHRYAMEIIGERYTQIVQPWQYGHGESKATCLWLRGLPPLRPTDVVAGRVGRCHRLPPGPNRSKLRAVTYSGIALAMAQQWGTLKLEEVGEQLTTAAASA